MYLTHFGLRAAPFALTPDTAFAFSSRAQREALDTLVLAVDGGEGFIKITGEVGTGKTLLCRRFLGHAAGSTPSAGYRTAYVPNPCLSPRSLLLAIARELKIRLVNITAGTMTFYQPAMSGNHVKRGDGHTSCTTTSVSPTWHPSSDRSRRSRGSNARSCSLMASALSGVATVWVCACAEPRHAIAMTAAAADRFNPEVTE